jgi:N-acetyl-anhydromuramyl-L-alanine amidase AmpD
VFWPYHWFVREDGRVERLLKDHEIGWQAGDWDINCRSVAICFDGDYENSRPSDIELHAAAKIIKENYSQVSRERIFGHREVNPKTTCPSNLFLSEDGKRGWKEDLLSFVMLNS